MYKRGLCCRPVFVCPSVCLVGGLYPDGWRYRQTFCSAWYPIILVFWPSAPISNSEGNPFSGGAKYTGKEKNCDFRLRSPFIWETVGLRDKPMEIRRYFFDRRTDSGSLVDEILRMHAYWRGFLLSKTLMLWSHPTDTEIISAFRVFIKFVYV